MELNREQVIKALECCLADRVICDNCPIQNECESNPFDATLARYALALIKELTEENERLHASCTELTQCCTKLETLYKIESKRVDAVKADTVRKMQELIKGIVEFDIALTEEETEYLCKRIDEAAKEMLEGEE